MGHKVKSNKLDVQKNRLKKLFADILNVNIDIMCFQLTFTDKEEEIKGLKKLIRESEKARDLIYSVCHYEILVSLYNTFINGKETFFVSLVKTINRKDTIVKWDRTKKGFDLFLKLESEARAKSKEEYEKKLAKQEMIKKAKEEGKKIEMVYIDGKLEPHIVEEKSN